MRRPVVLVGPLWELVSEKLVHDYPHNFTKCLPEVSRLSGPEIEDAVQKNLIVDYRRRGSHFEVTSVSQVKEICDKVSWWYFTGYFLLICTVIIQNWLEENPAMVDVHSSNSSPISNVHIPSQSCHGILDISLASVERLHRHNIYPIVLLLKFRHHKQIREVCDSPHPSPERISQKEAKEMYELAAKMEQEYKHVISGKNINGCSQ